MAHTCVAPKRRSVAQRSSEQRTHAHLHPLDSRASIAPLLRLDRLRPSPWLGRCNKKEPIYLFSAGTLPHQDTYAVGTQRGCGKEPSRTHASDTALPIRTTPASVFIGCDRVRHSSELRFAAGSTGGQAEASNRRQRSSLHSRTR